MSPVEHPISDVLDLHTFAARDVKIIVEEYLFQCAERKWKYVRIIHGKGTGMQKEIVRSILKNSPYVESFTDGPDWGSTAVNLKLSTNSSG